jgi:hypothetical protein
MITLPKPVMVPLIVVTTSPAGGGGLAAGGALLPPPPPPHAPTTINTAPAKRARSCTFILFLPEAPLRVPGPQRHAPESARSV